MSAPDLRADIASLPRSLRTRLDATGFDAERLVRLAAHLGASGQNEGAVDRQRRNRVSGLVEPPRPGDIADAPQAGAPDFEGLAASGLRAIRAGELAFCVMAGGMATRMGGVVKALIHAIDTHTFLELRLNENAHWGRRAARPLPLWLMTSEATDGAIRQELARLGAGGHIATFMQDVGLRLTTDGRLMRGPDGLPSTYATGHGDLPDALRRSGLLSAFIEQGGRFVWIANLDNLGATVDPALLGYFAAQDAHLLVEVAPKAPGDRGGIPVWADARDQEGHKVRRLQVLEEFRLPEGFDASAVRVFNTNTFLIRADALHDARVSWNWCEVEKKVGDSVAIQFERLLQDLTAAMPATYVRVPRESSASRFLPAKDHEELARRRETIAAVAAARGMI